MTTAFVINSGPRRTIYTHVYPPSATKHFRLRRQNLEQSAGFRNIGSFFAGVSSAPKVGTIS
jgi:hypothetical protein